MCVRVCVARGLFYGGVAGGTCRVLEADGCCWVKEDFVPGESLI